MEGATGVSSYPAVIVSSHVRRKMRHLQQRTWRLKHYKSVTARQRGRPSLTSLKQFFPLQRASCA